MFSLLHYEHNWTEIENFRRAIDLQQTTVFTPNQKVTELNLTKAWMLFLYIPNSIYM